MLARTAVVVVLFVLSATAQSSFAQGLSSLGGGSSGSLETIPRPQVRENSLQSFRKDGERLHDQYSQLSGEEFQRLLDNAVADFRQELERKLDDLEGDGALTIKETVEAVGQLRKNHFDRLHNVLQARNRGFRPPPVRDDFEQDYRYWLTLTEYILLERNPWTRWLALAATLAGGLLVVWVLNRIGRKLADSLHGGKHRIAAAVVASLRGPLYLGAVLTAVAVALTWFWLPEEVATAIRDVLKMLLLVGLFWLAWNLCDALTIALTRLINKFSNQALDGHENVAIRRGLKLLVLIGFIVAVSQFVMSSGWTSTGVLAGLGLLGIALWFVLHQLFESVTASFTIFGDNPFRVGDMLIVRDTWGTVEDIGFRSTRFRTFDGHLWTIPNTQFIREMIDNVSARPYIRRRFRLSLPYDTEPEKVTEAIQIVKDILAERSDSQPAQQEPHVLFETFGDYDLRLLIQYHFQPPDYWGALEFDSEVNLEILRRFNDAGIRFAFPTHTSVVETDQQRTPRLRLLQGEKNSKNLEEREKEESEKSDESAEADERSARQRQLTPAFAAKNSAQGD